MRPSLADAHHMPESPVPGARCPVPLPVPRAHGASPLGPDPCPHPSSEPRTIGRAEAKAGLREGDRAQGTGHRAQGTSSTPRSLALAVGLLSLVAAAPGCTLYAGQPWGEASTSVEVAFAPDASRLDEQGRLKTSLDYTLELERLSLVIDEVRLVMSSGEGGATSFDPSSPPEGYSLCHGGHCHHESGRLVDYAEIERELSGGGGAGFTHVRLVDDDEVHLGEPPRSLTLAPCEPDCQLPRGTLVRFEVAVSQVRLAGQVTDLRSGERVRLEGGSARVLGYVPVAVVVAAPLEGALDKGEPVGLSVEAALSVTDALFDGIDFAALTSGADPELWQDLSAAPAMAEALAENLARSELSLAVARFDVDEREIVVWTAPAAPTAEEEPQ